MSMASQAPNGLEKQGHQKTLFFALTQLINLIVEQLFEKWNTIPYSIR